MSEIVIFGFDTFGKELAKNLKAKGDAFVIADNEQQRIAEAEQDGFISYLIDIANDDDLASIGIAKHVKKIFCLMPEDNENLFLVLSCRNMDKNISIISFAETSDSKARLLFAGSNKVIDPYEIAAHKAVDTIVRPIISEVMETSIFGSKDIKTMEIKIPQDSKLEGMPLGKLDIKEEYDILILGIVDDAYGYTFTFITKGLEHIINCGDTLVVLGRIGEIKRFRKDYLL